MNPLRQTALPLQQQGPFENRDRSRQRAGDRIGPETPVGRSGDGVQDHQRRTAGRGEQVGMILETTEPALEESQPTSQRLFHQQRDRHEGRRRGDYHSVWRLFPADAKLPPHHQGLELHGPPVSTAPGDLERDLVVPGRRADSVVTLVRARALPSTHQPTDKAARSSLRNARGGAPAIARNSAMRCA